MSGHNKWSQIKNAKAKTDGARSKVFAKMVKLLSVESKKAGGDVNSPGLRNAIEKARKVNMPMDNIDRAVKKGTDGSESLEKVIYEIYGPEGSQIIVTALTDSTNRTNQEIKHLVSKNGASMGGAGSVMWNFTFDVQTSEYTPQTSMEISDSAEETLNNLLSLLDDHDDVEDIFTNISE